MHCREPKDEFVVQVRIDVFENCGNRKELLPVFLTVSFIARFHHYLPLDGMVNIPIYLVWASWVRNGTTFQSDYCYFEIQT